ncbi:MAG: FtsQ-type POTRA domain-containing protein [Candidatus Latescibacteria bacterium]|nr:FtsQ-type POTRA domain-containing protein [Candidatus Latescibacterota bacterium]
MRLLCLLALCLALPSQAAQPLIERISIQGPTRTRAETIRRELLVAVGQPLDSALVAETERNLRQLPFLGQVQIRTRPSASGVELVVEVEDLYSRALSPLLAGQLDELSYGLVALDYNLGGRGQLAQLELHHRAVEGNQASLYCEVPRLAGSPYTLSSEAAWAEEGHDLWLALSRPFLSLGDPWACGFSVYRQEEVQRLYADRALSARYREEVEGGSLWLTRSLGNRTKVRPGFRLTFSDRHYSASQGYAYAPQDRRRLIPSLGLTVWRPRYVQERFVQQLGRTEDLQVGSWISMRAGLSLRTLGSDRSFAPLTLQLSPRFGLGHRTYVLLTLLASAQVQPGQYQELNLLAELLGYTRLGSSHSLALRLRAEALSRPELRSQFLLGADRGLRGVLPRRYAGDRRLVLNLEARPTFWRRPWWVLAGALFADGGMAWSGARPDLRLAGGGGLRLGLPRLYNTPILRADLARGLPRGSWLLSVGLGQYF